MQTFPCGHRVVCRKCFVKTIQMVVTQRMLPLRCVICRAKVIRLKQTTTGGLSTGHVRLNSKHSTRAGEGGLQNISAVGVERGEEDGGGTGFKTVMINGGSGGGDGVGDGGNPLSRPSSLLLELSTAGLIQLPSASFSTPSTPTRSPASPLTEVFRAQRALYELQYLRRTRAGLPPPLQHHHSALDLLAGSADQEQEQVFSGGGGGGELLDNMGEVSNKG